MTNAIEVEDVHKVYRGKNGELVRALDGISFHVPAGPHLRSAWTKRRRQVNTRKDPQHDYATHFGPRRGNGMRRYSPAASGARTVVCRASTNCN